MKLIDLVDFIFSKNAGPFVITFDIGFKDSDSYRRALAADVFTPESMARLFKIEPQRVVSVYPYDAALTVKFSITRDVSSGTFGDRSVFGSQQWAPLIDMDIPDRVAT